jgi:predicted dehydrogenase
MPELRVAIVGYGVAGRFFHAPLIEATAGLELTHVVTSDPARQRWVAAEHPSARAVASFAQLWEHPSPDLVVVATPNRSHAEIAAATIERSVPVVVDKPLAVTAAEAQRLVDEADRARVMLTVFQNRRWDTDQLTLRRLISADALGEIRLYESRFERWRPERDPGKWREAAAVAEGGGVLLDLGSHLVDQALTLFGPISHVYAELASHRGGPDDDAFLALRHESGTISHLRASAVTASPGPRLRVQGSSAAFVVPGLDPQEAALRDGERPGRGPSWGMPEEWEYGRLVAGERSVPITPEPGAWPAFYAAVRDAADALRPPPVDPRDAVSTLRVIEAAREAARNQTGLRL